ncbi:MAG: N-acetylmuramoyl-L-alanine amidase [Chlamydiales bacterium]|nr:N-acetylmuramoyl-L-alanine amidase [Chlamydiales bacterium]
MPSKMETIVIDAGHGGKDGGSISQRDSYEEKELTLETAHMIRTHLNQLGYKTVMTRTQDTYVPLSKRAEIANSLNADLFVSIHYNYSPNNEAQGIEVYYYKEEKNPASSRIVKSKALGSLVLKKVITNTGADSRGVKEANFAVIRETKMPAILVEAGFLSNPKERERVRDPKYQRLIARAIAQGIDQYLEAARQTANLLN